VADEVGDRRLQAVAHIRLLDYRLELGDIEAAEREFDALQRLADASNERYLRWALPIVRARHVLMAGRLAEYDTLAHEAFAHRYEGDDESALQLFQAQKLVVCSLQGRHDELVQIVKRLAAQYPQLIGWRCLLASVYARLERWAQARQQLEALAYRNFEDIPRDASWLSNLSALSEVAAVLGDVRRAQLLYTLLLPYADRCVLAGIVLCQGSASRPLGLLAAAQSRFDDAERHFEQALAMNARMRSVIALAQTQCDYAHVLRLRSHPHDNDKALELINAALATAEQFGVPALADRARPLKLAAEAAGPPPVVPSTA
jgi:tetratricopeptide (TPR) repeat protein